MIAKYSSYFYFCDILFVTYALKVIFKYFLYIIILISNKYSMYSHNLAPIFSIRETRCWIMRYENIMKKLITICIHHEENQIKKLFYMLRAKTLQYIYYNCYIKFHFNSLFLFLYNTLTLEYLIIIHIIHYNSSNKIIN